MNAHTGVPSTWDFMTQDERRQWYEQQSMWAKRIKFAKYLVETGRISEHYTTLRLEDWGTRDCGRI